MPICLGPRARGKLFQTAGKQTELNNEVYLLRPKRKTMEVLSDLIQVLIRI